MTTYGRFLGVLLALTLGTACVRAIELGDPAPPLKISEWLKGKPVTLADGKNKKVYVVEFWATWCGPCRMSIPHLTEIQEQYKDKGVVLIGVSDEPSDIVAPFVEKQGEHMNYTVACDDGKQTGEAYMKAFKQNGIPTAFIIDKGGRIVWIGHPMAGLDDALDEVLSGKFDLSAAKKRFREQQEAMEKAEARQKKVRQYFELVSGSESPEEAATLGAQIVSDNSKDAQVLNAFAWNLLTSQSIPTERRDVALAMRAAQAAYDACDGADAAIVDTYARALFDTGKVTEAVKYQKKAVELADNDELREQLENTLKEYREKIN